MPGCPGKTYRQVWQAFSVDHLQVFCTGPECSAEWSKVCGSSSHKSRYQEVPGSYYPQTNPSSDPCDFRDLVSRAKWINSQSSLAAIDARQHFNQDWNARVSICLASAMSANKVSPDSSGVSTPGLAQPESSSSETPTVTDDALADEVIAEATKSPSEEDVSKSKEAADQVNKDIRSLYSDAKEKWKMLAGEQSINGALKEAVTQLGESFEMAADASSGKVDADTASLTKSKDYVDRQADVLDTLAHRTPQEWLESVGGTSDPATSEQQLDDVSAALSDIKDVANRSLPLIKTAEDLSQELFVPHYMLKPTTAIEMDTIAIGDMWSRVSGSTRSIDIIQSNIKAARSMIR